MYLHHPFGANNSFNLDDFIFTPHFVLINVLINSEGMTGCVPSSLFRDIHWEIKCPQYLTFVLIYTVKIVRNDVFKAYRFFKIV